MGANRLPYPTEDELIEAEHFENFRTSLAGGRRLVTTGVSAEDAEIMRRLSRMATSPLSVSARSRIWQNAVHQSQPIRLARLPMAGMVAAAAILLCAIALIATRPSAPAQLTQIETGLPFAELPVITRDNLGQLIEMADLGGGAIYSIHWLNETTLAAISARGILLLDSDDRFATQERIPVNWRDVPASYHLSADGRWLAAITDVGVSIYDLNTGEQHAEITAEGYRVTAVHINQPLDDTYPRYVTVATVPESGTVTPRTVERYALGTVGQFLDVQRLELPFNQTGPFEITGLVLSPGGDEVTVHLGSGMLAQMEFAYGSTRWTQSVLTPSAPMSGPHMVLSPDGMTLAVVTYNGIVMLDAASGESLHTLDLFDAHVDPQQVTSIQFASAGDALLISTSTSGVIRYDWISETMEAFPINQTVQHVAVNPDQTLIATLERSADVSLWYFGTTSRLNTVSLGSMPIASLAISGSHRVAASHAGDNSILLADLVSGQVREVTLETTFVNDIAFSPDGAMLAASLQDFNPFRIPPRLGSMALIDVATEEVQILASGDEDGGFSGIAFDDAGTLYGVNSLSLQAWEGENTAGNVLLTAERSIPFTRLAVSADGAWAAWSMDRGEVLIVDLTTQDSFVYSMPRYESVVSLEFVPGSQLLAVSVYSGGVHLIDPETTTVMALYELPEVVFGHAVISPDGSLLAVQTFDRQQTTSVRFWDLATGEQVTSAIPENIDIRTAEFSEDGRLLITAGNDGIIRVWGVAE